MIYCDVIYIICVQITPSNVSYIVFNSFVESFFFCCIFKMLGDIFTMVMWGGGVAFPHPSAVGPCHYYGWVVFPWWMRHFGIVRGITRVPGTRCEIFYPASVFLRHVGFCCTFLFPFSTDVSISGSCCGVGECECVGLTPCLRSSPRTGSGTEVTAEVTQWCYDAQRHASWLMGMDKGLKVSSLSQCQIQSRRGCEWTLTVLAWSQEENTQL